MINNIFPDIYVINLIRRIDRFKSVLAQSKKYGFKYKIIEAIDANDIENPTGLRPGEYALLQSHKLALETAKANNLGSVLILEDDFVFVDNCEDRLQEFYEIPEDFEVAYLGANHSHLGAGTIPPEEISSNIIRVRSSFCTHAMVVKSSLYDLIIESIENDPRPLDVLYVNTVQSRGHSYGFKSNIVKQIDSHSDIVGMCCGYNASGIFD